MRAVSLPGTDGEVGVISCRGACAKRPGFKFGGWQTAATIAAQLKHCARLFIAHTVAAMHPRTAGHLCLTSGFFPRAHAPPRRDRAFTLIELLVVIAIIAILVGLLFPAFKAVQNQARSTQAKNDLTQIVNAVNAFYTEYGKYPLVTDGHHITTPAHPNQRLYVTCEQFPAAELYNDARSTHARSFLFPRLMSKTQIIHGPVSEDSNNSRAIFRPMGNAILNVRIDGSYDNEVANPYTANAGASTQFIHWGDSLVVRH